MKNFINIIALLILFGFKIFAQNPICKVVLVKNKNLLSNFIDNTELTQEDLKETTNLQGDINKIDLKNNKIKNKHSAMRKHNLIVNFYDNQNVPMTNQAVGINSIIMTEKSTGKQHVIPSTSWDLTSNYILIKLKGNLDNSPSNGEIIELKIQTNKENIYTFYFNYMNEFELYNFANNSIGLWLPINMYSTAFEKSENGVVFTAMPIGLVGGFKYNTSKKFYLGFSITFNYTMANASSQTLKKSYFLQDFSVGPLIDIGGYGYIGYSLPFNLTNEKLALKPQYVLGIGVKTAQLFKGI